MKKKRWIALIIVIIIVGAGAIFFLLYTFFLLYKQTWKSECQDFIDECYKRNIEFWGGMAIIRLDGSSNVDYLADCPKNCSRYTEERGYFKDKEKQKKYYDNKVKKCKKEYEECLQSLHNSTGTGRGEPFKCRKCDKYGQPINHWN